MREVQEEEVSWREGECPYCGKALRRTRTMGMLFSDDRDCLTCGGCGVRWLWDERDVETVEVLGSWRWTTVPEGTMLVKETT